MYFQTCYIILSLLLQNSAFNFWVLILVLGILLGFVRSPRDVLGNDFLPPLANTHHFKSGVRLPLGDEVSKKEIYVLGNGIASILKVISVVSLL